MVTHDKSKAASLLIKGGHVIDPASKLDAPMDVLVRDGRIAEVAAPNKIRGAAEEKLDARGLIVAPGFIDLHVHLREPGQSLQGDDRVGHGGRGGGRVHVGVLHAEHHAGDRFAGMGKLAAPAGTRGGGECVPRGGRDPRQQGRGTD